MTLDLIRELFAFNAWANARTLDSCAPLSPEQFTRPLVSSFPSVRDTLTHIVMGEWVWLELWLGRLRSGPERQQYAAQLGDLDSIRAGLAEVERERQRFLAGLTAAGLDHVIEYRSLRGNLCAYSLRHMMQHVVNHSTYHRGQVVTLLRQVGIQPQATDFLRYFDWLESRPED